MGPTMLDGLVSAVARGGYPVYTKKKQTKETSHKRMMISQLHTQYIPKRAP